MRNKDYYIVVDTETTPIEKATDVNAFNMLVYDIGWLVVDRKGKIYERKSFIVQEIFFDTEKMSSAYYAKKLPLYYNDLKNCLRVVTTFENAINELITDFENYNCKAFLAYNASFDVGALQTTSEYLKKNYNFYNLYPFWDLLKMARFVISKRPTYKKFCESNNYITKKNRVQVKAETVYRYITKNVDFIESHTALEDAIIESEIFAFLNRQHKKMPRTL